MKQCEVNINFKVPKDKMEHLFKAEQELRKAGVSFDTGASCGGGSIVSRDWEFDWSLKGAAVSFRRFSEEVTA